VDTQRPNRWAGYAFALLSTALWSGNMIVARAFNASITPLALAFLRWSVALIAFLPFALKGLLAERKLVAKSLPQLALTGLLGVSIFNTLIYYAGRSTSALNMSLISIVFPIIIIVLSRFLFGEAIALKRVLGIAVVIAGVLLLITKGRLDALLSLSFAEGDLLMLGAALMFALYSLLVRKRPPELSVRSFQFSTFAMGWLILAPAFIAERMVSAPLALSVSAVGAILYVGLGASLVAFLSWNKAIELIGASTAGIVYYSMPAFGGLLAFLLLGEGIGLMHALSAILIVAGIILASAQTKKKPAATERPA
jgi:drug/metabolite transporter (DMT)-like permease